MQRQTLKTLALLSPCNACNVAKLRIGGPHDGGYVMLDDFDDVDTCYSLGVGPDVSWDADMAARGATIYQYDHTVERAPQSNDRFRFNKLGITHSTAAQPDMRELAWLIEHNGHGHKTDMVLKMDIEGAEWDILACLPSNVLERFSQIVVEFHGLRLLSVDSFRTRANRVFNILGRKHRVVHVHGNNFGGAFFVDGVPIPDVLEVTASRRDRFDFRQSSSVFPMHLDSPCNSSDPDLFLGSFQFF